MCPPGIPLDHSPLTFGLYQWVFQEMLPTLLLPALVQVATVFWQRRRSKSDGSPLIVWPAALCAAAHVCLYGSMGPSVFLGPLLALAATSALASALHRYKRSLMPAAWLMVPLSLMLLDAEVLMVDWSQAHTHLEGLDMELATLALKSCMGAGVLLILSFVAPKGPARGLLWLSSAVAFALGFAMDSERSVISFWLDDMYRRGHFEDAVFAFHCRQFGLVGAGLLSLFGLVRLPKLGLDWRALGFLLIPIFLALQSAAHRLSENDEALWDKPSIALHEGQPSFPAFRPRAARRLLP